MPDFDFSSLQKEDDIISSQSDFETDDFDLQKNDDFFEQGIENFSLTDSESDNKKDDDIAHEVILDDVEGEENINNEEIEKDSNLIEESDDFIQNDLPADEKNDLEIIESGNEEEDFSTQEDDNDEVFDEKTFDFSQFGDLPGLNETLCEDDEEFWSEFDDKDDSEMNDENEILSENLVGQKDDSKQVINQYDGKPDLEQNSQYLETKNNVLNSEAVERISQIVDKATEISNNEILQKEREIENKTAVLGALNSADTALQMAMKTQQLVKDLEEKQKIFEEEFVTKSEKMIQEVVDKKFEENLEVVSDKMEFAEVDEFIGEEAEVIEAPLKTDVESEAEFADVTEFAESENEVVGDEVEFVDVSEVIEGETEFASVDEFIGEEAEVIEAPLKTDVESEAEFADVTEFAESENEVADNEVEFADVSEISGDDVEFADVSEVAGDESSNESRPSIDVCDFKNLRAIFEYLPENGKDSFVSNRIRMVVEYVIAKTSGKRGLLKTAKMWRKAAHLDNDEIQNDEDKVTAREVYDLVVYLKTLANELEDKEISKAICESADNVLQRIQL